MPTYQYACTACDHQLEAVQSFSDDPLTQCPVCQGRLRKLFGSVGIVFKGPGFYRTDSRGALNGRAAGTGEAQAGDGSGEKGSADKSKRPGEGSGADSPAGGSADRSQAESSGGKPVGSSAKEGAPAAAGSSTSSRSTGG